MRKLVLLVTLMVASIFMLGAMPGAASAANCGIGMGPMQHHDNGIDPPPWGPFTNANFLYCTGVSGVEVAHSVDGVSYSGWYDYTWGLYPGTYICLYLNTSCTSSANIQELGVKANYICCDLYRPFYAGGAAHWVQPTFWYRLRNSVGNTWGPWHFYMGIQQAAAV